MITDHTPKDWTRAKRSRRDKAIAWASAHLVRRFLTLPLSWQAHRRLFEATGRMRLKARGVKITRWTGGPRGGLIFTPPAPKRRLLWYHGGGFVLGSPNAYRAMLSHLARATNAVVISPRYALAPEHPFPAAADDAKAAAMAAQTIRPDLGQLHLGGDSAGGNLALVVLADLLAQGRPSASVSLASPATLMDPDRDVPAANDLLFPLSLLRGVGAAYVGAADPNAADLSPVYAEFPNPPPVLIQCAKGEYLEEDADLIAARLDDYGADVTIERAPHMPHVWHFIARQSPLALNAMARIGQFMDQAAPAE